MSFTVITGFTENTGYAQEADEFSLSAKQFNVPYKLYPYKSTGNWAKNCQMKAVLIDRALSELNTNIIWIDVDARFSNFPSLFDTIESPIAYHWLEFRKEVLSGTLFLKNCDVSKKLVKDWIELNKTNDKWDQKNLQFLLETTYKDIPRFILPAEYCKIFDCEKQVTTKNVITHFQASRRFKCKV